MGAVEEAGRIVSRATSLVAFTGAGISAESGIPTYRGTAGTWTKYDPEKFASVDYFFQNPSYYWSFFREERYPILKKARPNAGHEALARLEEAGKLAAIITQNIDGLHQEAGSRTVVELHGNTRQVACLGCGHIYTMDEVYEQLKERDVPVCAQCDGMLKTTVVLFGEGLPQEALQDAFARAAACDAMLCVGSSLVVYPAAGIPMIALEQGAKLIVVNPDPTPLDRRADVVLRSPAGEALPAILEASTL